MEACSNDTNKNNNTKIQKKNVDKIVNKSVVVYISSLRSLVDWEVSPDTSWVKSHILKWNWDLSYGKIKQVNGL